MTADSTFYVILVAAGMGERLGEPLPKALVQLSETPLFIHSLRTLLSAGNVESIFVTYPAGYLEHYMNALEDEDIVGDIRFILGGSTRQESVKNALVEIQNETDVADCFVLIHDAARCLVPQDVIMRTQEAVVQRGAVTTALPQIDSLKRVDSSDKKVLETIARKDLWRIQTPQAFRLDLLWRAHHEAKDVATDDAALVEQLQDVYIVLGDERSLKITTPWDLEIANALFSRKVVIPPPAHFYRFLRFPQAISLSERESISPKT